MTRRIRQTIACPACGKAYDSPGNASINYMDWREWSDGRAFGKLHFQESGVRGCNCGAYFFRRTGFQAAIRFGIWPDVDAATFDSGGELILPPTPNPVPEKDLLPEHEVSDAEVASVLEARAGGLTAEIEIALRRQLWQATNDGVRSVPRRLRTCLRWRRRSRAHPSRQWRVGSIRERNLESLLPLLMAQPKPGWLEIGEACRELRRFDEAISAFDRVEGERVAHAFRLKGLAMHRKARVAELEPLDDSDE